jgi:hypothetical protein
MFGMKKSAEAVNQLVAEANTLCAEWTTSPDGNEFFARFMNKMGYCLFSWEKGAAVAARSPKVLIAGLEDVLASVRRDGQGWHAPPGIRYEIAGSPDPRHWSRPNG